MKNKTIIITVVFLIMVFLCSCDNTENDISSSYIVNGEYIGFSNIPKNYSVPAASEDKCLVIQTVKEKTVSTDGYNYWLSFVEKSSKGEFAFIRVAHFIDDKGYYTDLYFENGKYNIFTFDERGISKGKAFTYLRCLEGISMGGMRGKYYVLTDSLELTYEDVTWSFISSNLSSVTKIPFEWLGFMIYFE